MPQTAASLLVLGVLCGTACSVPSIDDYYEARQACGLDDGEFVALASGAGGTYHRISETCSEHLGKDFGLDWEGFGAAPHAFDETLTTDEIVVSGLFVVASSDTGTVAELLDSECPSKVNARLRAWVDRGVIATNDPASAFWYLFANEAIDYVVYDKSGGQGIYYSASHEHTVGVFDLTTSNPLLVKDTFTIQVASTFVHEASHEIYTSHDECVYESCDMDIEGAYGVEARWLANWLASSAASIHPEDCQVAVEYLERICTVGIVDNHDYEACQNPHLWCNPR